MDDYEMFPTLLLNVIKICLSICFRGFWIQRTGLEKTLLVAIVVILIGSIAAAGSLYSVGYDNGSQIKGRIIHSKTFLYFWYYF